MGGAEAAALAASILDLASASAGAANFRFGVSFNCNGRRIPFFPAACAGEEYGFAIGTENSGLLREAMERAAATGGSLQAAEDALRNVMAKALAPVQELALQLERAAGQDWEFFGIDASIAPALEGPSLTGSFELLDAVTRFGGAGTLAACERVTAALKALPLRLCGYSGLMLPVAECPGLAESAIKVGWLPP